ncbi:hypothetical protein BpHYR1_014778 [Brachionus plicatilis]|uniref:Uncharacterized protein n=1 Tax=Brachionus plicatilis TaxID=10195 RepID=A0A3M7RVN8_BRAPC|nr:hypothetical protein BpHYR1_014778 [Brachionus plicatilis]
MENQWILCWKNPGSRYFSKRSSNGMLDFFQFTSYENLMFIPGVSFTLASLVRFTSTILSSLKPISNFL